MNKIHTIVLVIVTILGAISTGNSQNFNILNQANYGGSALEIFNRIYPKSNGGYFIVSVSGSNISGNKTEDSRGGFDIWVVSVDENNSILWDKTLGGSNSESNLDAVVIGSDLIFATSSDSPISGDKTIAPIGGADIWLVRLNSSGNIIWQNVIGGTGGEFVPKLTSHGSEIILSFETNSLIIQGQDPTTNGTSDVVVSKVDPQNGQVSDLVFLGVDSADGIGPVLSIGSKIIQATQLWYNNSLGGTYPEPEFPDVDNIGITVLNNDLTIDTAFSIGGSSSDKISDLLYDGNNYYVLGSSNSPISGNKTQPPFGSSFPYYNDFWIVKLDNDFNILWDKVYGTTGSDAAFKGYIDVNGKVVIIGSVDIPNATGNKTSVGFGTFGTIDTWCIVLDENTGDKIGDYTFGGTQDDYPTGFIRTYDGRYFLSTYTSSSNSGIITTTSFGVLDSWVAELDCSALLEVPETNDVSIDVYPNPVNQELRISGDLARFNGLTLISLEGREVISTSFSSLSKNTSVDISDLPAGIYVLKIYGNGLTKTKRIVKQ